MPIPVKIVDNESTIRVRPDSKSSVKVDSDCNAQAKRLESLIEKEKQERISADEFLQSEIDDLSGGFAKYIEVEQNNHGTVTVKLKDESGAVISSDNITITQKIIKSAEIDANAKTITFTCYDNSTVSCDISSILDDITNLKNRVSDLESKRYELQLDDTFDNHQIIVDTAEYPTLESFLLSEGNIDYTYYYPKVDGYYQYIWKNSAWVLECEPTQITIDKCLCLKEIVIN